MTDLAALTPMIVVGAAFVALIVFVKRLADREAAQERETEPADPAGRPAPPGPRVHMVPVDLEPGEVDDPEPGGDKPGRS